MIKMKIKIADYFIVGVILITGLAGFWFNLQNVSAAERKYAAIYVENNKVAELSLAPGDSFTYTLNFGENNQNVGLIEIEDGRVRMLPMDKDICPKGICSHTGWIEHSYESIVCLPNQIMIIFSETTGPNEHEDVDSVTF